MPVSLTLLDGVRWNGVPVAGERPQALLAALASGHGRTVRRERLVDLIWGEDAPADATKGLQVVVARTRAACEADVIVRDGDGYRLGVAPDTVDSCRLASLVNQARRSIAGDPLVAAELAQEAVSLAAAIQVDGDARGALAEVRQAAARDVQDARLVLARAGARTGEHAEALPVLEAAHAERPDDESLLTDLLRSEAAVRGPGAALDRFERHRRELRERLGARPGEELQRVHRELLALDSPVRSGVRFDATALLGRDGDVRRLRALLADSRVVSIVGPGGLGKTRLAHVLARVAAEPVVHVVELVGVIAPEDVVGEVGSALGVRDSVSGRRSLTPTQRADVRTRIAQHLAAAPSLLILDNCEHIVDAVAELVAFLVASTTELRVLTTSRAPLAIAAEHVYPLGTLPTADAAALFAQRAIAARPDVRLDPALVAGIVERLDGLPLAIELAAAKVRAMSVSEIDRRLEHRFALLRGGDRSAPDRHQTLLAVIDWSWNLLGDDEQAALRRLSVFHDGFTLPAAEAILGGDAVEAVEGLSFQSLLSVRETGGGMRYRMLETVREFGRMQLASAGEDGQARAARRAWASGYAWHHGQRVFSIDQLAAIDALGEEEGNLADVLREALAEPDPEAVVQLLAGLGTLWSVRGDHFRVLVLTEAVVGAVRGWTPPPESEDPARVAMTATLRNAVIADQTNTGPVRELLMKLGPGTDGDPLIAAATRVTLALDPADRASFLPRLEALAGDPDRLVALHAEQWRSNGLENSGDQDGAIRSAERALALTRPQDGPWSSAMLQTQLAQLMGQLGRGDAAIAHALAALPVLERLGARDDTVQLHALMALCAIHDGRLEQAATELDRIDQIEDGETLFGGVVTVQVTRAELALARGDHARGLVQYRTAVERMRAIALPGMTSTGLEPWILFGESAALAAFAYYGTPADDEDEQSLLVACRDRVIGALRAGDSLNTGGLQLDYPVVGAVVLALGIWGVLRAAAPPDVAVRLLVIAERFAYNRMIPTLTWERIAPHADALAPGHIAAVRAELGDQTGPELLEDAVALLEQLAA